MRSAVTLCLVPEAASGPFVLRTPLPEAFATAAALGFDAVELFLPGADFVSVAEVRILAERHGLAIAAVGTGAGWLRQGLSLTDASEENREAALEFVFSMIDFGGELGAPAILGSMQGRGASPQSRDHLVAGLRRCADRAATICGWPASALRIAAPFCRPLASSRAAGKLAGSRGERCMPSAVRRYGACPRAADCGAMSFHR